MIIFGQNIVKQVAIGIPTGLGPNKDQVEWFYSYAQLTDLQAFLLERYVRSRFSDAAKAVRAEAYAQGWRDAKAKNRRETDFSGWP